MIIDTRALEIETMDAVPKYLFHRDILKSNRQSDDMTKLKQDVLKSEWVKKVVDQQWNDGSWGQFHSLSSTAGLEFTTEKAMRRLYNLGLDKEDEPIKKVMAYMESFLHGQVALRDRVEKKHDWGLLTRLFAITWLLKFDPDNATAREEADKWAKVVSAGFERDSFDQGLYTEAYQSILKPEHGKFTWGIQNFYIVSLLTRLLAAEIEDRFLDYIMNSNKGIYYIYDRNLTICPDEINSLNSVRFLTAHEILSGYESYPDKGRHISSWLLENRTPSGIWDFGPKVKDGMYTPLSDSWRKRRGREVDSTFRALRLLHRIEKN